MSPPSSHSAAPRPRNRVWIALAGLMGLGGLALAAMPTKRPPDPERGRTLYRENCWQCHGFTGEGAGPVAAALPTVSPPLAGRLAEADYDRLAQLILSGKGDMPGFSAVMDRHDARRVLIWLGTLDPEHPHDVADDAPADKKAADGKGSDKAGENATDEGPEAGGGGAEGGD